VTVEVFATGISHPAVVERVATGAEAAGYDGMLVVDSQNLAGDPYVGLALAARATSTLKLGTGVTNPGVRHPVATAAGIASVHAASGGRAVLGIGRGDSAMAHLGLAPAPASYLERYVVAVRAYLAGETLDFEALGPFHREGAKGVETLGMADVPKGSALHWLDPSLAPVPVEVVATGPRVLDVAARRADRVLLAVGADPARVGWAVDRVRATKSDVPIASFVNVVVHDDPEVGRRLAAGGVTTFARFSVMDGKVRTPIGRDAEAMLHEVHDAYDMNMHTRSGSPQAGKLTAGFTDEFAIIGTAAHCLARLEALVALGIDRFIVVGPSIDADPAEAKVARRAFAAEVLPTLRRA
jgi:5,10-methylenetetrahydromethanopterin reductase